MKRPNRIEHVFVEFVPDELAEATLYISIPYATAVHSCLCGCGQRVVTPLSPTDWELTFDGVSVSLDPSIGNWSFPCRSHYFIRRSRVRWAGKLSEEKINAGRARDRKEKEQYFKEGGPSGSSTDGQEVSTPRAALGARRSRARKILDGIKFWT
jgi:Family of unknown function (DUF6527)